jgi:hypothetical protein
MRLLVILLPQWRGFYMAFSIFSWSFSRARSLGEEFGGMLFLVLVCRSGGEGQGQVGVEISGDVGLVAEAVAPSARAEFSNALARTVEGDATIFYSMQIGE